MMSPKWFSEIMAFSWLSPDLYSWKNRILWWRQTCRAEEDWARGGTRARWRKTDVYKFYNFTGIAPMEVSWSIHRKHRKCRWHVIFLEKPARCDTWFSWAIETGEDLPPEITSTCWAKRVWSVERVWPHFCSFQWRMWLACSGLFTAIKVCRKRRVACTR